MKTMAAAWRWVKFECIAAVGAKVFVSGTFNDWKPSGCHQLRDRKHDGVYRTLLQIRQGAHEYKYLVNGEAPVSAGGLPGNVHLVVN